MHIGVGSLHAGGGGPSAREEAGRGCGAGRPAHEVRGGEGEEEEEEDKWKGWRKGQWMKTGEESCGLRHTCYLREIQDFTEGNISSYKSHISIS